MTDPAKRKLSARQILADIRSGMDAPALKREHDLSDKSFEYVLKQLTSTGLLTGDEIRRLEPGRCLSEGPRKPAAPAGWRCPACNAPQPVERAECPACGVVVAKFLERKEQRDHDSRVAPRFTREPDSREGKGWMPVIVSIVVFALIGGAVVIWSTYRGKEKPSVAELEVTSQPSQEVEGEADQLQETVEDLASVGQEYSDLKIEDDQEKTPSLEPLVALPHAPHTPKIEPPSEAPTAAPEAPKYVTGVLRQFGSGDFKKEVVEASKTYPVLFQFYSDT
jgi:hypothetical protein